jgi:WD40 repeat protein
MKGGHHAFGQGGMYLGVSSNRTHAITVGQDGLISAWNLQTGQLDGTTGNLIDPNSGYYLRYAGFGKVGRRVAIMPPLGSEGYYAAEVWNCETGTSEMRYGPCAAALFSVPPFALAPDEASIAVNVSDGIWDSKGKIRIVDVPSGAVLHDFDTSSGATLICYSPSGNQIGWDEKVRDSSGLDVRRLNVGSLASGEISIVSIPADDVATPVSLRFSPNGRYLAEGYYGGVKIWDLPGRRLILKLPFPQVSVTAIAFSEDESLFAFSGSDDWAASTKINVVRLPDGASITFCAGHPRTMSLEFGLTNNVLYSTGSDGKLLMWNPLSGMSRMQIDTDVCPITALAFARDGQSLAAGFDQRYGGWPKQIKQRSIGNGAVLMEYGETGLEGNSVCSLDFAASGTHLAAGYSGCGGSARVFESTKGQTVKAISGATTADYVSFSPAGNWLFVADNYTGEQHLRILDAKNFIEITNIASTGWKGVPSEMCGMTCLSSSPSGTNVLVGHSDNVLRLWDWRVKNVVWKVNAHLANINRVAFAPDGASAVSASDDQTVKVWDATTGVLRHILVGHKAPVKDVAFSPCGRVLASAGGDTVRFWDPNTGIALGSFDKETARVCALAFSPNGAFLAFGRSDPVLVLARNPFFVPPLLSLTPKLELGFLLLTVTNSYGSPCFVQSSSDLSTWADLDFPALTNGVLNVLVNREQERRFFRVRVP